MASMIQKPGRSQRRPRNGFTPFSLLSPRSQPIRPDEPGRKRMSFAENPSIRIAEYRRNPNADVHPQNPKIQYYDSQNRIMMNSRPGNLSLEAFSAGKSDWGHHANGNAFAFRVCCVWLSELHNPCTLSNASAASGIRGKRAGGSNSISMGPSLRTSVV